MAKGFSILSETHSIEIILVVHDNPGMRKTAIVRSSPTGEKTRSARIDDLVDEGILEMTDGDHWRGQYYNLTEMGEELALHLIAMRDLFPNDVTEE